MVRGRSIPMRGMYKKWVARADQSELFKKKGGIVRTPEKYRDLLYPPSVQEIDGIPLCMIKQEDQRTLAVLDAHSLGFSGLELKTGNRKIWFCPLDHGNAVHLRSRLAYTSPTTLRDRSITFGVGDRLGIATPGHIRVLRRYCVSPVLAQQSPRELELGGRTYRDIIDPATWAVFQEGFTEPWGADGDHLKTVEWVKEAVSQGFSMITADLSDHMDTGYAELRDDALHKAYDSLGPAYRRRIERDYLGYAIRLDSGERIAFSAKTLAQVSLVYHRAIEHARILYHACTEGGRQPDFEVSIDETDTPTPPEAHVFVARELQTMGLKIVSIAPRFIGKFEKAVDFEGDIEKFKRSFSTHSTIAAHFGHKLSIHSGSDKFSIYPLIGDLTSARFHLKTCGTSWLLALSVIAHVDPSLFRDLYDYAESSFSAARRYYQSVVSPDALSDIGQLNDKQLPGLLEHKNERQVLHITYGHILSNRKLKQRIYAVLTRNIEQYWILLEEHIGKHLRMLGVKER
jgi:hypothetical protein